MSAERLLEAIRLVAPAVENVTIGAQADSASVRVFPPGQQAAAQAAIDAFDWSQAAHEAWLTGQARGLAKAALDRRRAEIEVLVRAFALVTLDELNNLRSWIAAFKTEVANSSTLTDLRNRVAALPNLPDRTATQLRNAIKSKIDAGSADA